MISIREIVSWKFSKKCEIGQRCAKIIMWKCCEKIVSKFCKKIMQTFRKFVIMQKFHKKKTGNFVKKHSNFVKKSVHFKDFFF